MYNSLNRDSLQRIQNIANGFRNFPAYAAYRINSYTYDAMAGIHALEITRDGRPINLFLFYPSTNGDGKMVRLLFMVPGYKDTTMQCVLQ